MNLTLDLFADPEPASEIEVDVDLIVSKDHGGVTAHIHGFEEMAPETQKSLGDVVQSVVALAQEVLDTASRGELPDHATAKKLGLDHHMYAFIAQARKHGHTDPALTPACVTEAGVRIYEEAEVKRFANELLRGVRSIRPAMTPERWGEAIQRVREMGEKP